MGKNFQVCLRDEYGQTSIVSGKKHDNILDAVTEAKELVTEDNINNALTLEEKKRNWSSYYVELLDIEDQLDNNVIYSGKGTGGRDMVLFLSEDNDKIEKWRLDDTDAKIRLFIGKLFDINEQGPWYAEDTKKKIVDKLSGEILMGKSVYYIMTTV